MRPGNSSQKTGKDTITIEWGKGPHSAPLGRGVLPDRWLVAILTQGSVHQCFTLISLHFTIGLPYVLAELYS